MTDLLAKRKTETAEIRAIRCLYEHGFTDEEIAQEARTTIAAVQLWRIANRRAARPEGLPLMAGGLL